MPLLIHATKQILDNWGSRRLGARPGRAGRQRPSSSSPTSSGRSSDTPRSARRARADAARGRRAAGRVRAGRTDRRSTSTPRASCRMVDGKLAADRQGRRRGRPERRQRAGPHLRAQRAGRGASPRSATWRRSCGSSRSSAFVASAPGLHRAAAGRQRRERAARRGARRRGQARPQRGRRRRPAARRSGRGRADRRGRA